MILQGFTFLKNSMTLSFPKKPYHLGTSCISYRLWDLTSFWFAKLFDMILLLLLYYCHIRGWHWFIYIQVNLGAIQFLQVNNYEIVVNFFISAVIWHDIQQLAINLAEFTQFVEWLNLWTDKTIHVNLGKIDLKKNNLYKN